MKNPTRNIYDKECCREKCKTTLLAVLAILASATLLVIGIYKYLK